jgi:hypothetical protein
VVVDLPLFLKELSMMKRWYAEDGKSYIPYFQELLTRNDNNQYEAARDWYNTQGEIDGISGPTPTEVAEQYLEAIDRLKEFAKKQIGDRELVVGMVGHSFELDALIAYLANNGNPTLESFDKISKGSLIKETELTKINIGNEESNVEYRGEKYDFNLEK